MDSQADFDMLRNRVADALKNPAIPDPDKYACREGFWVPYEKGAHTDQFLSTVTSENYHSCVHSAVESTDGDSQTLNLTYLLTQKADPMRGLLVEVKNCVNCYVWDAETASQSGTIPELLAISSQHKEPEFVVLRARSANASVGLGFVDLAVDPDRAPYKLSHLETTANGDLMATVAHHKNKPWIEKCDLKLVFPKGSTARSKTHLHFDDMSFKVS